MSSGYIGRELNTGHFTIDRFSGNDAVVSFTLSYIPGSTTGIQVIVDNIIQEPDIAYSLSGDELIFSEAPPIGTDNIYVIHQGISIALPTPADGSVGENQLSFALKKSQAENFTNNPARNKVQNQEALTQGESSRAGMESLLGTATSGLDTTSGDFGFFRWSKDRVNATFHVLSDSIRGFAHLRSDTTAIEVATIPTLDANDVTWTWQTTKRKTGLTNRNKAYTCHYNPDMNFSIVGYEGDGVDGHEIPHHLGVVPELTITKDRDSNISWLIQSQLLGDTAYLSLDTTSSLATNSEIKYLPNINSISIGEHNQVNNSTKNFISYHFASKSGVCKIGKYIGTGQVGNYVSTEVDGGDAFKPAWIMVKNLTTGSTNFLIQDSIRGDYSLNANTSQAEGVSDTFDFIDNGFVCKNISVSNALNDEYIFMAFAESSIDATKALTNYDYAIDADTISIAENTLVSVANGFSANGQVDTQFQFGAGVTDTFGVGFENKHLFAYTDKLGNRGYNEIRPLSGITRKDADRYGVVSPSNVLLGNGTIAAQPNARTTSKHFDYESDSGVALASGEYITYHAWHVLNKDSNELIGSVQSTWLIDTITTSWVQYKHNEKRILKSWRIREADAAGFTPNRFTIEGSDDGLTWTEIDVTYKTGTGIAFGTVTNGAHLWSPLQDTSTNTTAYLYHRINITENNGHVTYTGFAELEFNTVIVADYFLVEEGQMYDSSDTPIERVYLGHFETDGNGDVIKETIVNYPIAEQEVSNLKVHKDLTVYGEANGRSFATAWVNFDGTQNPPLIFDSFNIKDIVDLGTGNWRAIFETPMDVEKFAGVGSAGGGDGSLSVTVTNKNYVEFWHYNIVSHTVEDHAVESVIIFGGKQL